VPRKQGEVPSLVSASTAETGETGTGDEGGGGAEKGVNDGSCDSRSVAVLIHHIFAQGEGLMGKLETLLHGEHQPEPEKKKNQAQIRADLIRQEINRLQNWQLRMVKL
jgi:hypothetical protein